MPNIEETVNTWVDATNRHDSRAAAALYAQDCVVHDPFYPEPLRGRAAAEKDSADFFRAFPDVRVEVISLVEKGGLGAAEFRMTGTNTGPLATPMGEIPATRKAIDVRGAGFVRLNAEGLVVEERRYYDTGTMMQQLGLAQQPEAVGAR